MNYLQAPYPYAVPLDQPIGYGVPISHYPYEQTMDQCYLPYHQGDIHGFYAAGAIEEYEEYVENLSRPRLTKEQVEILESQFQAHPKPNSNTKRQLALQTSLTLPRVANWFQNRRAKAKQQKRQEEFEKMQAKEKAMAAEGAEGKQEQIEISEQQQSEEDQPESIPTPTDIRAASSACSEREDHGLQTPADESPEPKFDTAGHQPEIHAEISNIDPIKIIPSPPINEEKQSADNIADLHSTLQPSFSQPEVDRHYQQWDTIPQIQVRVGSADESTVPASNSIIGLNSTMYWTPESNNLVSPPFTEFLCNNTSSEELPCMAQSSSPSFNQPFKSSDMPLYSSQTGIDQQSSLPVNHSDVSMSSGPNSDPELTHSHGRQLPRLHISTSDKAIGLAARRKRPRPAAIGTSGLGRVPGGPPSMSPTRRVASAAWSGVRKTSQLAELSPRYGGLRKISGSPRSPFPYSIEGRQNGLSNTSELTVPPSTTSSIPPATPLTPEDMQHLLPPTPIDSQYCLSPQDEMGYAHSFPNSQTIHFNEHHESKQQQQQQQPPSFVMVEIPHATAYQPFIEPMSAPPNFTNFAEVIPNCTQQQHLSHPEVDASLHILHMPQPTHISPIAYDGQVQEEQPIEGSTCTDDWQAQCQKSTVSLDSPISDCGQSFPISKGATEFYIQEFPQQDEALRMAAQQLPPQESRNYTFTNQTPNDFYRTAIFPSV